MIPVAIESRSCRGSVHLRSESANTVADRYVTDYAKKSSSASGESSDTKEGSKSEPKDSGEAKSGTKEKKKAATDTSKKKNSASG